MPDIASFLGVMLENPHTKSRVAPEPGLQLLKKQDKETFLFLSSYSDAYEVILICCGDWVIHNISGRAVLNRY